MSMYFIIGFIALIVYGVVISYQYHTIDWAERLKHSRYSTHSDPQFWTNSLKIDWIFPRFMIGIFVGPAWPVHIAVGVCFYLGKYLAQRKK